MISFDTNVLYAAFNRASPLHHQARSLLESHIRDRNVVLCEQVLAELYVLLRNATLSRPPLSALQAARLIETLRENPVWRIVDVPEDRSVMDAIWKKAERTDFASRRIFDLRLAATLRHHGVEVFYTRNTKDFRDEGFLQLINPFELRT